MTARIQVGSGFVTYEPRPQEEVTHGGDDGHATATEGTAPEVEAGAPE